MEFPPPPYDQVDPEIRCLVSVMNSFAGIHTVGSCAGHEKYGEYRADVLFVADTQLDLYRLIDLLPNLYIDRGDDVLEEATRVLVHTHHGVEGDGKIYPHGPFEPLVYDIKHMPLYRLEILGEADNARYDRINYVAQELQKGD